MKLVGSRAGNVIHVGASRSAERSRVAAGSYSHFLNLVEAERKVGGPGIVQVQIRIVVVHAIDRKEVAGGGDAVGRKVAVTRLGVHSRSSGHLRGVSNVVAGVRRLLNLLLGQVRPGTCIANVQRNGRLADLDGLRRRADLKPEPDVGGGADLDFDLGDHGMEIGRGNSGDVRSGLQQRKQERALRVGMRGRFCLAGRDVLDRYPGVGHRTAGGICDRTANATRHRVLRANPSRNRYQQSQACKNCVEISSLHDYLPSSHG